METIWIVFATAFLTAVITLTAGYVLYLVKIKPELENRLERVGPIIEERVREGVLSAGRELLPAFREKVTEGLTGALAEWPTSEMTRVLRGGTDLLEGSLNSIFGKKRD